MPRRLLVLLLAALAVGAFGAPSAGATIHANEKFQCEFPSRWESEPPLKLKVTWPEASMLVKGMAKPMLPAFERALQGRPAR